VHLFHGTADGNTPVEEILQIQETANKARRKNIHVSVFQDHDHSLDFLAWVVQHTMPEGIKGIFDEIEKF
jgi:dipeptidyl aminopeptidase/acylaminoacyl peptidase